MGRKTLDYTVPGVRADQLGARDNGKTFRITEMPAAQAFRWATRLMLAASKGGLDLPPGTLEAGPAGLAAVGVAALGALSYDDAGPLLDEMLTCVQYVPEAANVAPQRLLGGDACQVEEIKTFALLHAKVFELHTGFSLPAVK